jgi:hypothetical protein
MTRARVPRAEEVAAASLDPRFRRAFRARPQDDPTWSLRGACRSAGVDPDTFWPHPKQPCGPALAVCAGCPVQDPCLATALTVGDCDGVWGATTPRERRAMLAAWRQRSPRGHTGDPPTMTYHERQVTQ